MANESDYKAPGFWKTLGILVGAVPSRIERENYKFSGPNADKEWERFKRDRERDEWDGH